MKPELLLPVGNTESFYAALEGGADAIYLGLRKFNARDRAKNFTVNQLQSLLKESEKNKINVHLTLNTLIKNQELPELLDTLYLLSQTAISAIIIQDWGVYYLIKKFFPKLKIHASTQMKTHNSIGTEFLLDKGFERVILARELTLSELKEISRKSKIELEIFAHGALCYSFSGMCLLRLHRWSSSLQPKLRRFSLPLPANFPHLSRSRRHLSTCSVMHFTSTRPG